MFLPPCCIGGVVDNDCARNIIKEQCDGVHKFGGHWRGWKIDGQFLVGPNKMRFSRESLLIAWWHLQRTDLRTIPKVNPGSYAGAAD